MSKVINIVACIPAYNEELNIAPVILRTRKFVDQIIVCDDGSADLTGEIAQQLGAIVITHKSNMGKGAALKSTIGKALEFNPDYIVTLDSDGQHQPEEIPLLIEPLKKGEVDLVIGSRYINGDNPEAPIYRKIGLGVIDRVFKHNINANISDSQSGFRAYTYDALQKLTETRSNGFGMETEQLSLATKQGLRIKEVPVNIRYNGLVKTSKKNPVSHGGEIISGILRLVIRERPIQLLGFPGVLSLILGLVSSGMFLYYFNTKGYVSIPFALISTASILLGAMLILIALVLYAINMTNKKNTDTIIIDRAKVSENTGQTYSHIAEKKEIN